MLMMDLSNVEVIVNAVVGKSLRSQEGCNAYIFAKVKERMHQEVCDLVTKGLSQLEIIVMQKKRLQAIFCGEKLVYEDNQQKKGVANGECEKGLTQENGSKKSAHVTEKSPLSEKQGNKNKNQQHEKNTKKLEVTETDAEVQNNGKCNIESRDATITVGKDIDAKGRKNDSDNEKKSADKLEDAANLKQSKRYFEYLAEYKNDPGVYDRVKGTTVRGKNFPVSNDGSCPRCSFQLNAFVVLDFLFPEGDMPEIIHYLLTLGKAVLWSSKQTETFKDPPVFLCQGQCPSDIGKSGFNISWRNTDLDKIFLFPDTNFKEKKTKRGGMDSSKSTPGHDDSDDEYYEGDVDIEHYKTKVSWVVLDEIEEKGKNGSLRFDATEVVRTMLALEEARLDFTNGCMKKLWSEKSHPLGGGMAQIFGNYSRGRSKSPLRSPAKSPMNNRSLTSVNKVNSAPPLPKKAPPAAPPPPTCNVASSKTSFSKTIVSSTASKPNPPIFIKPIASIPPTVSSAKTQRSLVAPTAAKANIGGQLPAAVTPSQKNQPVVNSAPTPTHVFKGATYYNSGDDQANQPTGKPAFTNQDFPISTDGACPYCHSADVVYIILQEDDDTDPLPELLLRLNKMGKAVKRKKGEYDLPSFQCKGCTYGFNLDWKLTNLEKIFFSSNTGNIQQQPQATSLMSVNVNQNAYSGYNDQQMNNYSAYNASLNPYAYMYQQGAANPAMMMNQYGNYMQPPAMAAMQAMMNANAMQSYASIPSVPPVYGLTPDSMKPPSGYQNAYNSYASTAYNQNQYGGYPPPPPSTADTAAVTEAVTDDTAVVTEEATTTTTTSTSSTAVTGDSQDLYDPFNTTTESAEPNEPSSEVDPNIKPQGIECESAVPSPAEVKADTKAKANAAGDENSSSAVPETKKGDATPKVVENDLNGDVVLGPNHEQECDEEKKETADIASPGTAVEEAEPKGQKGSKTLSVVETKEKKGSKNVSAAETENEKNETVLGKETVKRKSTSSTSGRGKGRGKGARGKIQQQKKNCETVKMDASDGDSSSTEKAVENIPGDTDKDDKEADKETISNGETQLMETKKGKKVDLIETVKTQSDTNTDECDSTDRGETEVDSETVENEDDEDDKPLQATKRGVKRKAPAKRGRGRGRGKKKK